MKLKLIIIVLIFIILAPIAPSAEGKNIYSMRRCVILPIVDGIGGSLGFKVFQSIEPYLKNSNWCYYRSNSGILNILANYRQNLEAHLQDENVLKVVAEKTKAGSLIFVKLVHPVNGIEVNLKVFGSNGKDLYYNQKVRLKSDNPGIISDTIINWLEHYEKTIPYDGKVLGVLGKQFTVDVGKISDIRVGNSVIISRPLGKKTHPLLKRIVEWDQETIARGKIFNVSEFQASGVVKSYHTRKKIQKNDWVKIDLKAKDNQDLEKKFEKHASGYEFGKLGIVSVYGEIGKGSQSNLTGGTNRKINGYMFGLYLDTKLWVTRNYFGEFEIGRKFGSFKKETGTVSQSSNTVSLGTIKVKMGYKYLPLGFFYGPQIDGYIGYAQYGYSMDTLVSEGFGDATFKGVLLGMSASAPIYRDFRVIFRMELFPKGGYSEDVVVYGEDESVKSYQLEFGAQYFYSPVMTLNGSMQVTSNKAKFANSREVRFSDTSLRFGVGYTY